MIDFEEAATCLKALAHPGRLAMIHFLVQHERASVGELAKQFGLDNNVASEHLSLMKAHRLLLAEREGRFVYYSIKEPLLFNIIDCITRKYKD